MKSNPFALFEEKMKRAGTPDLVIQSFKYQYDKLVQGEVGLIPESVINPIINLPDAEKLTEVDRQMGQKVKDKVAIIKLNGGLGTSMGMDKAKSLLKVKNGLNFLDIIVRQVTSYGAPLILMNTTSTRSESLVILENYSILKQKLPLDFVQNMVPKVRQNNFEPVVYKANPDLEWCPPGHGDIYLSLQVSGLMDQLLETGYRYVFVSNADNLGAMLDLSILGYFVRNRFSLMVEAADRTENDRKGGHLAQSKSGKLILREVAQCPEQDLPAFQDIDKHRYFNTNNIWLDLEAIKKELVRKKYLLSLPLIKNKKTVDPKDPESTLVYQLETAMGSAVSFFKNTAVIRVPKCRFAPVKTTNELLAVRSDAYILTKDYRLVLNPKRKNPKPPIIELDPKYYKMINDFEARVKVVPSLVDCDSLTVRGNRYFINELILRGINCLVN